MDIQQLIFETLKDVQKDVQEIKEGQIKQSYDIKENKDSLSEHMRRTEIAEERLENLEKTRDKFYYFAKVIAGIGGLIGVVYTSLQIIGYLGK